MSVKLQPGVEVSFHGTRGRFRFDSFHESDGSLTCYGPINSQRSRWRSFRPEKVKTIHRKKTER